MHTACLLTDDGGGGGVQGCVSGGVSGGCVCTPPDPEAHINTWTKRDTPWTHRQIPPPQDPEADFPPSPDRQITVKTLPCPKLHLRVVIMQ